MRSDFDVNESENAAYQTLGDAAKAVLQGKFIVVLKKKSHISNFSSSETRKGRTN